MTAVAQDTVVDRLTHSLGQVFPGFTPAECKQFAADWHAGKAHFGGPQLLLPRGFVRASAIEKLYRDLARDDALPVDDPARMSDDKRISTREKLAYIQKYSPAVTAFLSPTGGWIERLLEALDPRISYVRPMPDQLYYEYAAP